MSDSDESSPLIGTSMVLTLDGQKVSGRVVQAYADRLVVKVSIHQPAKGYTGVMGKAILPDGKAVKFDIGRHGHFSEMVIDVPLPTAEEQAATPEQERRKFFRLAIELPIEIIENVGFSKEYVRASGETVNLSGGGMLLDVDQPLLPGVYKFRVHLPTESLTLTGRVIRKPANMGAVIPVEWVDVHEMERSKLIRFIFQKMRNLKNPEAAEQEQANAQGEKPAGDEPRYWRRREKFYKPNKIRYW